MALTPKQNFIHATLEQLSVKLNQDLIKLEKQSSEKDKSTETVERIVGSTITKLHGKITEGFPLSAIDFKETELYTPEEGFDGSKFIVISLGGLENVLHSYEHGYVAVGFMDEKGVLTDATVYNPFNEDRYTVSYSNGAFSTFSRLRTSKRKDSCEFAVYNNKKTADEKDYAKVVALITEELNEGNPVHMTNSCLLDMILVAAGKKDAFVATGLSSYELEFIKLFTLETGCVVSDFKSNKVNDKTSSIVMTNSKLHAKVLNRLNK